MKYREEFHSKDSSTIIRKAAICSVHDLFLLKPICWSLMIVSREALSRLEDDPVEDLA